MRILVVVALVLVLLVGGYGVVSAQSPWIGCVPWGGGWTDAYSLNLLACDYGLGALWQGILDWFWPEDLSGGLGGGGGSGGFYGDLPDVDVNEWVRWCFARAGQVQFCKWGRSFDGYAKAFQDQVGEDVDPIGLNTGDLNNTLYRAILVTPPGAQSVSMYCTWYMDAQVSGLSGGKLAQAWVRFHTPGGATSSGVPLPMVAQAVSGGQVISGGGYMTVTLTAGLPYTNPVTYGDYVNHVSVGYGARAQMTGSERLGTGVSYAACSVESVRIGSDTWITPRDEHEWMRDNPDWWNPYVFPPPVTIAPVPFVRLTDTHPVDFGITPGDTTCLQPLPATSLGPVSAFGYTVSLEVPSYEFCLQAHSIDLEFAGFDFGEWFVALGLVGAFGIIYNSIRRGG